MGAADQEDPRLFGTVRDAGGQPVTSPRVWLRDRAPTRAEAAVVQAPPGNNGIVVSFLQNSQLMQELRPDKQADSEIMQLGSLNLCHSVIRSIETARNFDFEDFPVKDKVSHMYYTGRLEVFNENFLVLSKRVKYEEDFEVSYPCKAFIRCVANPGKVQSALSSIMIEKLNLTYPIYADVVTSLQRGDLKLLRQALDRHEEQ
ncbi:hypothetical protein EJB05_27628, partial [Eragrostis curvula]